MIKKPTLNLKSFIKGEVLDDNETLTSYSKDASIFEIKPQVVTYPKDSQDIQNLVKYASDHSLSITPRCAGTDMTGAAIGEGIILDLTKHLNQLLEIKDNTTTVEPGMLYKDFEVKTLQKNLLLPTYPASREICTIGGMIANNAGGELELTYGPIDKYLQELKVILSDGNEYIFKPLTKDELNKKITQKNFEGKIYSQVFNLIKENKKLIEKAKPQTSKNSTGYELWNVCSESTEFDLSKLIIGSQGTLGIITQAKFKLITPKKHQALLVIELPELTKLDQIVKKVLEFKPESFECFDDQTLKLAVDHAWDLSASFKHSNRISAFLSLKSIGGTLPKLVLMANFNADSQTEALQKAQSAKEGLKQFNLKVEIKELDSTQEKYWIIRHKSFGLLMKYSKGMKASSFIDDIIVRPEYLHEFLPKLNEIIAPYKNRMVYTLAGHIGDGNFHIIPLMDLSKEDVRAIIPELMEKVFKLVFSYHGSMSAEHNDGMIRGPYLPEMYGQDMYQLFKEVKQIFDPNNIFNPHKKIDATFKYSLDHLVKS